MDAEKITEIKKEHISYWANCELSDTKARSYVYKALANLYLSADVKKANDILNDTKIKDYNSWIVADNTFVFYWTIPALIRCYSMFNCENGTNGKCLLPETGENIKRVLHRFVEAHIDRLFTDKHEPLRIVESENHEMLQRASILLIAQLLKADTAYKNEILPDGRRYEQLFEHACEFMTLYFKTRAKIGGFVEGSDNYRMVTLESIYNLMDLCENKEVAKLARMMADITWIEYVTENVNSVRGCAKARVYNRQTDAGAGYLWFERVGNMYFDYHNNNNAEILIIFALSNYLPPEISYDIMKEVKKTEFESMSRIPGVGRTTCTMIRNEIVPIYFLDEEKSITKYTYVTQDFIMSSLMQDEREQLIWLSAQNRWAGMVFSGDTEARMYIRYESDEVAIYKPMHIVQKGSVMLTKNVSDIPVGLYISDFDSEKELVLEDGWLFGEIQSCYYAVKQVDGGMYIRDGRIVFKNNNEPIVTDIKSKREYKSLDDFKEHIHKNLLVKVGDFVFYQDIEKLTDGVGFNYESDKDDYRMVCGDNMRFDSDMMIDNPYIKAVFNSGIIDAGITGKKIRYDFNKGNITTLN